MTTQHHDAAYIRAATDACNRLIRLLDDAYRRGVHTAEEYDRLRAATITEQEAAWNLTPGSLAACWVHRPVGDDDLTSDHIGERFTSTTPPAPSPAR